MKYHEHIPSEPIRQLVDRLWLLEGRCSGSPDFHRIPPDGCSEIIFQMADRNEVRREERIALEPQVFLLGQQRQPIEVRVGTSVRNLGIRFRPGGLFSILRLPMHELVDQVLPLADVWAPFERELGKRLDPQASANAIFRTVENALWNWLPAQGGSPVVNAALDQLSRASVSPQLSDLARLTGWGPRQLQRRFRVEVGYGPKMLGRIWRFQRLVRKLSGPPLQTRSWSALALDAGYADQPHLIREFRELSGTTPVRFVSHLNPLLSALLPRS